MDINLKRGDIVVCVVSGDYGKPRPAVIVQADLFNETHASITLCPLTTTLLDAPLIRISLKPTHSSGLEKPSQIMVDKIVSLSKDKIRAKIGELSSHQQQLLDEALRLWLGLS